MRCDVGTVPPRARDRKAALRYRLDRMVRHFVMALMMRLTPDLRREPVAFEPARVRRILIVRSLFRMGDAILATPAIRLFRNNFPAARIDFVGPPISLRLFENLPIDRHYTICKSFPRAAWSYLALLKQLRREQYDLAFDASGSSAALGAVIVGFSGARLRIGLQGRWDRWFNVRFPRPPTLNKYEVLPALIGALGLESRRIFPKLLLAPAEIQRGAAHLRQLSPANGPIVGVFVGGRRTRGKRWHKEKFAELARRLAAAGARSVFFLGPEERDWLDYFQRESAGTAPVILEPDVRKFAALVANCDLFVACDGGPVHLACALRVRTIAIFIASDANRWGPPAELGRILSGPGVCVDSVLSACLEELRSVARKSQPVSHGSLWVRDTQDQPVGQTS